MAQGNQIVTLSAPGATSGVQSVTCDKASNTMTVVMKDGTVTTCKMQDIYLDRAQVVNDILELTMNDGKIHKIDLKHFHNVQSDWKESNVASDAYIKNKPTRLVLDLTISPTTNDLLYTDENGSKHTLNFQKALNSAKLVRVHGSAAAGKYTYHFELGDGTDVKFDFTPSAKQIQLKRVHDVGGIIHFENGDGSEVLFD